MGNKMAELDVILSEMHKIRKAVWLTARVGDPWILTMFIWCCDSDAFRRVQRIWTEADFRIVRGCSASMTKGVSGADVETMSVLPACLQVMHRRHRSFVIERASYTLTGKSSPMCVVRGLSEVAMICASAVDPNHKMMMRFTQDPTLVSMLIGFATLHEQVFVTAAMRHPSPAEGRILRDGSRLRWQHATCRWCCALPNRWAWWHRRLTRLVFPVISTWSGLATTT